MTKKKVLALSIAAGALAIILSAATMAYFTDKDSATNTFTVGNVKIDLIEQQRKKDDEGNKTTELEDFVQDQPLLPIVGSAQGEADATGLPVAANYQDKIVTIKNTGVSDAWVRAYFAIPSALDDGYETFNAGLNSLHFNFGNENGNTTYGDSWIWLHGSAWNYFETTIDGVRYNVYFADYATKLAAGETTTQFVQGVYLDKGIDTDEEGYLIDHGVNLGYKAGDTIKTPVYAVAVQASGFNNAADAINAALGANYNPFGGTAENWQ